MSSIEPSGNVTTVWGQQHFKADQANSLNSATVAFSWPPELWAGHPDHWKCSDKEVKCGDERKFRAFQSQQNLRCFCFFSASIRVGWVPQTCCTHNAFVCPQVVEECYNILKEYNFRFVRRGPIFVKGKGELLTYFLKGRDKQGSFIGGSSVTLPHQVVDN